MEYLGMNRGPAGLPAAFLGQVPLVSRNSLGQAQCEQLESLIAELSDYRRQAAAQIAKAKAAGDHAAVASWNQQWEMLNNKINRYNAELTKCRQQGSPVPQERSNIESEDRFTPSEVQPQSTPSIAPPPPVPTGQTTMRPDVATESAGVEQPNPYSWNNVAQQQQEPVATGQGGCDPDTEWWDGRSCRSKRMNAPGGLVNQAMNLGPSGGAGGMVSPGNLDINPGSLTLPNFGGGMMGRRSFPVVNL